MTIPPDSIAPLKAQVLSSMVSSVAGSKNDGAWDSLFQLLVANGTDPLLSSPLSSISQSAPLSPTSGIKGLSATGRNMALPDPESAYKMMSVINNLDVAFKAQYSELNQMKAAVSQMQEAGQNLGSIATGNDSIKLRLLGFVGQYNNWIRRFNPDIQQGGLLAGTQAAQVAQYELEQNIKSRFFGAGEGVRGMGDLGIEIDPQTHLAAMDTAKLDSMLSANRQGTVNTIVEFGANFARSASLLVSEGNFFSKQLDNLDRGIDYVTDNKDALQQEFGSGDAANPTGQVAAALADYNKLAKT